MKERVRLHKFLADCGLGSRRACEELMRAGRVTVDGVVASRPGIKVDPEKQVLRVDGRVVRPERKVYLALHKPTDVVCTSHDPAGRRTCGDLVPNAPVRLYTVGRLDRDSEGLILLTNDGDFAHALAHPRHEVEKAYRVWVGNELTEDERRRLRRGVLSEGDRLAARSVRRVGRGPGGVEYEVTLCEGKKRHIRRMFKAVGHSVRRLKRVRIGNLELGSLRRGASRALRKREVASLMALAGCAAAGGRGGVRRSSGSRNAR